jgi:phospholipid transport system transporter-binding protein
VALSLPGTLTLAQAGETLPQLHEAVSSAPAEPFCIDAGGLKDFDSAALALLLQAKRLTVGRGLRLELRNVPEALLQLAALYGVAEVLGLQSPA